MCSDLDAVSQAQLDRGYRLTELLKQGLNSPLLVEEQVVSIWAGTRGHLDSIEIADVGRFESELLDWFRTRHAAVLTEIRESGTVSDENNMPLPGATVLIAGTSSGTTTDFDGKFQLNVNTGDVLEISYVGYATQSVTIGIANSYNVTLETDNQSMVGR